MRPGARSLRDAPGCYRPAVFRCRLGLALFLVAAAGCPLAASAQDEAAPIDVRVLVDDGDAATTAQATLTLEFTPLEDVAAAYTVALRARHRGKRLLTLDHGPEPPTRTWKKGTKVTYTVPVPLPLGDAIEPPRQLTVHLGFQDPETRKVQPPQNGFPDRSGFAAVALIDLPPLDAVSKGGAQEVLDAASRLATAGQKGMAWRALTAGVRRAVEDGEKYLFRDAMLALGDFAPPPVSVVEQRIVDARIADEKRRYMRQMSGRFFDRKQYHASLAIIDAIGGSLQEEADKAVLGAVNAAARAEKDKWDVRETLLLQITEEEISEADAAVEKRGQSRKLLDTARGWLTKKRYAPARRALQELRFCEKKDLRDESEELLTTLDKTWVADVPPDQAALVSGVVDNPAWGRTATLPMQEFILIGPRALIESISAVSKRRFDVAYVFLTDLFGRVPNPAGDRVTVYFKELWEFSGGTGGGKQINIGNADPERRGSRLDTGLLYHELTHCIDDTKPVLGGWREGLANVGAVFAFEALGQTSDSLHGFDKNLSDFEKDYVARDLAYWRIPNYGPSAGFFLHFVRTYAKRKSGHDWKPLRGFFRDYRDAPVRDGRTTYVARAVAFYLMRHFGEAAFDDLVRFRLPLVESDREAVRLEMSAFADGDRAVRWAEEDVQGFENSPLKRDLVMRRVIEAAEREEHEAARTIARDELGVLFDWRVIGPFATKGTDPGACIFPPQDEIDFAAEYPGKGNICKWRKVTDPGPVSVRSTGWVDVKYAYMDHTASYGLTHVTVPEETPVAFHVRGDDDVTLYVNGDLVEGLRWPGTNSSRGAGWRGPHKMVADGLRLPWTLRAGRNRILVRVRNGGGVAGFSVAVCKPDGSPLPALASDDAAPAVPLHPDPPKRWKPVTKHDFRQKSFTSKLDVAAGRFVVMNKLLSGAATDKRVAWRKYTVRPGVTKDNPSNLMWLKDKFTKDVDEFRLTMDLVLPIDKAPKMLVTFQGDGGTDGLSGWNLILHSGGKKVLRAELERYQRLFHQCPPVDLAEAETRKLVLTYHDRRLTVWLGTALVLDRVPVRPIAGQTRIGIATWGPDPKFASFQLDVPRR